MLKWVLGAAAFFVYGFAVAGQSKPLSPEGQALVQAVMALQAAAQGECEALPAVKRYTAALEKAKAALKASGVEIDWATGGVKK